MKLYNEDRKRIHGRPYSEAYYAIVKTRVELNTLVDHWKEKDFRLSNDTLEVLDEGGKVFCYRGGKFYHTTSTCTDFRYKSIL